MRTAEVKQAIRSFFEEEFRDGGIEIRDSMDLAKELYVDSLTAAKVVFFLERTFQLRIRAPEIRPANFHSIDSLTRFVCAKLGVPVEPRTDE